MTPRVRKLTGTEVERLLARHGFRLVSQRGSHRKWRNDENKLQVVVPMHKGKTLPLGTLISIMKSADVPESEWKTE